MSLQGDMLGTRIRLQGASLLERFPSPKAGAHESQMRTKEVAKAALFMGSPHSSKRGSTQCILDPETASSQQNNNKIDHQHPSEEYRTILSPTQHTS